MDPMPSCSPTWVLECEVASFEYTGSVHPDLPRNRASSFFSCPRHLLGGKKAPFLMPVAEEAPCREKHGVHTHTGATTWILPDEMIPKWASLFQATTLGYSRESAAGEGWKTENVFQGLHFQGLANDVWMKEMLWGMGAEERQIRIRGEGCWCF